MMRSLTSFSGGKWYQRTVTCGTVSIRGFAQRRTDNKVIIPQPPATFDGVYVFSHFYLPERTPDGQPQRKPSEHQDFQKYVVTTDPAYDGDAQPIKLILMEDIEELGEKYEVVEVPVDRARWELLLPRKAMYASPFNLAYFEKKRKEYEANNQRRVRVPSNLLKMAQLLMGQIVTVCVSADASWIINRDILITALQSLGIYIIEPNVIHLTEQQIKGPDPALEGSLFRFYMTLDDRLIVPLIGRINHISLDASKKALFPSGDKQLDEPGDEQLAMFGMSSQNFYYSAEGLSEIIEREEGGIAGFMARKEREQANDQTRNRQETEKKIEGLK